MSLDIACLVPEHSICGEDPEETALMRSLATEAGVFVGSFKWCEVVLAVHLGLAVGDIIGVALVTLIPRGDEADECVWVVLGDLPPLYLTTEVASDAAEALEVYIDLMRDWVEAVRRGEPLEDVVPVDAPATEENADALDSRLQFLREKVLGRYYQFGDSGLRSRPGLLVPRDEEEGYEYSLRALVAQGQLWGLEGDQKWGLTSGLCNEDALPVWLSEEFTLRTQAGRSPEKRPRSIPLDSWLEGWLPKLAEQAVTIRLYQDDRRSVLVAPARLSSDLRRAMDEALGDSADA